MVGHAGSGEVGVGRLMVLGGVLLALGAIVPACTCEGPTVPIPSVPDVGLDVSPDFDADVDEGEDTEVEDVADADLPDDADDDASDVDGDAGDDAGDVVEEDRFLASCLFPVLDCLGANAEAVSCTINTVNGETAVSYGNGRAARWSRDGQGQVFFEAFVDSALCYEAQALDPLDVPFAWDITSGGDQPARFGVARDEDDRSIIVVTCPDASVERYRVEEVQPYLPSILAADDELCVPLGPPRCEENPDCQIFDESFECCPVAGTARCLVPNQCPAIPEAPPELDSCLTEMLDCFGLRHVPLACSIDPNVGTTDVAYTRGRRAVVTNDGFDNFTIETSSERGLCYVAATPSREPFSQINFTDPNTNESAQVTFEGGRARVVCADNTREEHDAESILQYVPILLDETEDICTVEPINVCSPGDPERDCEAGLCCPTLDGNRCLDVEACPEVRDPWDTSCMRPLMDCFGANQALAICIEHTDLEITEVGYVSGARATYYVDQGRQTRRTFFERDRCFEAVQVTDDGSSFEISDLTNGDLYEVRFVGDEAQITCPDAARESVPARRVRSYLPARPNPLQCNDPLRDDQCSGNNDCGDGLECCNVGDRNLCLVEGDCDDFQPRQACSGDNQCGEGSECCELSPVRVCNPRLCGDDQLCCALERAEVCAPGGVCDRGDICDPGNPDDCNNGELCCSTLDGNRCLNVQTCPDLNDPWGTSCLFGTFECFGTVQDLLSCTFDPALEISEVEYESGARMVFYESAQRPGRRASFGGQPCFNALEGPDGLEVEDLLTGERFVVEFNRGDAQITCPGAEVQVVPASDVLAYLPQAPDSSICELRDRNDNCDQDADCGPGLVCCDTGDRNLCLASDDCERSQPLTTCLDNSQCGRDEVCCERELVNVCDVAVCGDRLCCSTPSSLVCGSDTECNRVDACDPLDLSSCQPGEQCCETELGKRCLGNVGVCPDPDDPIGTSCIALVLECFGANNELDRCTDQGGGLGITQATYVSGSSALFFTHEREFGARTANSVDDCYQILGSERSGFELVDLLSGNNYSISVVGPEATVSCPFSRTSVIPIRELRPYLPVAPEPELCDVAPRQDECTQDSDCNDNQLFCCNVGDRNLCLISDHCQESLPRVACDDESQCADGEVCCGFARARVCDPALCDGELCCDLQGISVCTGDLECDSQVFDECEVNNPDACPGDDSCCPTDQGSRCLPVDGGQCPSPIAGTCLEGPLECFGRNPTFNQCLVRDEPNRSISVTYAEGSRNLFTDQGGQEHRLSGFGPTDCFEALANGNGWDLLDLETGDSVSLTISGSQVFATCPDNTTARAPLALIQEYLPAPPIEDQCVSPQIQWEASCLFGLLECSGADLVQDSCIDYGDLVDRTEVDYGGGVVGIFSNRAGVPIVQTRADGLPCFEAAVGDTSLQIVDLISDEAYQVEFAGNLATIRCPNGRFQAVDSAFIGPYIPERPAAELCEAAPRNDLCQVDADCGDPQFVCCDVGEANLCLLEEGCLRSEPRPLCDQIEDCASGQFCCDRANVRVCDPDLCGDAICCDQPSAQVCGTEDECNGIFDLCSPQEPGSCGPGSLCCDTIDGNRCIGEQVCPPPPDPLEGSCIHSTLLCFGRFNELAQCIDYGQDVDVTLAQYVGGQSATFYTSSGRPARRTSFAEGFECYDAFEDEAGGFQVQDLFDGGVYEIAFDGIEAVITCPDASVERVRRSAVRDYFTARPQPEECQPPGRDDECQVNADCDDLVPGFECCDGGDRNVCVEPGSCPLNSPHATCDVAEHCGGGQECCDLGFARICDPTVCGADVCCNVFQARVCGENAECNNFVDVCSLGAQDCPGDGVCCATNNGSRCFEGINDRANCPVPENPFPESCLFDAFDCAGEAGEIDQCVDLGSQRLSVSYSGGSQVVFEVLGGREFRRVSSGGQGCFTALTRGDGFNISDLRNGGAIDITFQGANARVTCADDTIVNIPRPILEAYLPSGPVPQQCQSAEAGWRGSCLFGLFECFGDENRFDACLDYGTLNFTSVDYNSGNVATFFNDRDGAEVVRTRDVNQQPCFRAEGNPGTGFEVEDLLTGERYGLAIQGDVVRITCPDDSVADVLSAFPLAYIPSRPDANLCEDFNREDRCQVNSDCGNGFVCCDLGDQNFCTTRESCERSRPRPTCDNNSQCQEGTTCCEFGPSIVCDPDQCGGQPCCSIDRTDVCGTADDCNGIFNVCTLGDNSTCGNRELCCETNEGDRCVVGNVCPPPPDPLIGSCLFDLFSCFGRLNEVDSCVDYGSLDMTETTYTGGKRAVFYTHEGEPTRIAGDNLTYCFEAVDLGDGFQIRDLDNGDIYSVALGQGVATIQCPDAALEQVPLAGLLAYLPERPAAETCAPFEIDTGECAVDADCRDLDPLLECCDTGDRTACLAPDGCRRNQVRATCNENADCGQGQECCSLFTTRVCDPTLCGEALCCDVGGDPVCGTHLECNEILDVCEVGNNATCGNGEQCCDTISGSRCIADNGGQCPPVPDLFAESCLFEAFECFGRNAQLLACFDVDGLRTEVTYTNGSRNRFFEEGGFEGRLSGNAFRDCFRAVATDAPEGGFTVIDARTRQESSVTFIGDQVQILCSDSTVFNVARTRVEAYLPARPEPVACDNAEAQWQRSCLFGTFECFGDELQVDQCANHIGLGIQQVEYASGSQASYFFTGGQRAFRARSATEQCFQVLADNQGALQVQDLITGEVFGISFNGDAAQITCPGQQIQTVLRSNVDAYLPDVPDPCDPAPRDDRCQADADCRDPQLICCDSGDRNTCATRDDCARSQIRVGCDLEGVQGEQLEQGTCEQGQFCCGVSPRRVCDPSRCGGELCCTVEEGLACGTERDCAGIVDVCTLGDAGSCAQGQVCCPTEIGTACVVGNICPPRANTIDDTCLGGVVSCFGPRQFESCEVTPGLDRVDSAYSLNGEVIHFTDQGAPALLTASNGLACYSARVLNGGDAYEIVDVSTGDRFEIAVDGISALVTCPDATVQPALLEDLLPFVPARPLDNQCTNIPRQDECTNDAQCGQGLVCCDTGQSNACLAVQTCFRQTPRETCAGDGADCGEGRLCCQITEQRVCNPSTCGLNQVCCDTNEAFVCGTPDECADIFDECDVNNPTFCAQGDLCCPTLGGNRCTVGGVCPEEPDPIDNTCLADVFECFGRDRAQTACVDFGILDRTEASYGADQAVFYTYRDQSAVRTRSLGQPCYEAIDSGEGGYLITNLNNGDVFTVALQDGAALVTCADNSQQVTDFGALRRHIPQRPAANACQVAVRQDECTSDAQCRGIDPTHICCDIGDQNICGNRETCARATPVSDCVENTDCAEGTLCCVFESARYCDPTSCDDDLNPCCNRNEGRGCATEDQCNGRFDRCDLNDHSTCGPGAVCCPNFGGAICLGGDACPEPPDEIEASCIGSTLGCFGRDQVQLACVDYGTLDRTEVSFEGGTSLIFFERFASEARRALTNGVECYDAVRTEAGFEVRDLFLDQNYAIAINGGVAEITCPFGNQTQQVPLDLLLAYLPDRPAPNTCAPFDRNDECVNDAQCGDVNLGCCDIGDRNICLTRESCTRNQPRPFCDGNDADCGQGQFCCEMPNVRVCDPEICPRDQACCDKTAALVCATDRECNGIIDLCDTNDAGSCNPNERCCELAQGTRCLVGLQQCPAPPDPIVGTCLESTFGCFERNHTLTSCVDFGGAPDRTEATYNNGAVGVFFSRRQVPAMRAVSQAGIACFNRFDVVEDGSIVIEELIDDQNGPRVLTHRVAFVGPNAVITCADAAEFTLPRSAVEAYLPDRPDAGQCAPPVRDDECQRDADCLVPGEFCCDIGDRTACLPGQGCFENTPRPICAIDRNIEGDVDETCPQGTLCCDVPTRVCDPAICGGEVCCTPPIDQAPTVCATEDECNQIADFCALDNPASCPDNALCCPTAQGNRCIIGECPEPPDPVLETCLLTPFGCFGADNVLNACVDFGDLDRTEVTFSSGAEALYFTDSLGRPTMRASDGVVSCFDAFELEGGSIEIQSRLNPNDNFTIEFFGQDALIVCNLNNEFLVPRAALDRYLPARPAANACGAPVPNNECDIDLDCLELDPNLRCCDMGDRKICGSSQECSLGVPRRTCIQDGNAPEVDSACPGQAPLCCEVPGVRVCDPDLCGDQVCCFPIVQDFGVCGTSAECNGLVDFCAQNADCVQGQACCETNQGNRCINGGQCPDPPDPMDGSCLQPTLQCFGRSREVISCEDFGDLDLTVAQYDADVIAHYYTHQGAPVRRTELPNAQPCYEAIQVDGGGFQILDLSSNEAFQVAFNGQTATISCPGNVVETVPTAAVLAYMPDRPAQNACAPANRGDQCQQDAQCRAIDSRLGCCDVGDQNICGSGQSCAQNILRQTCDDEADCAQGDVCCPMVNARVCNPSVCLPGQTCCNPALTSVCATRVECSGVLDHCVLGDPLSCGNGERCCESTQGNRCIIGNACPELPDPVATSCLGGALLCFGADNALDSCTETGPLGVIDASYVGGSNAQFFTQFGRPARRASFRDVPCFSATEGTDGRLTITDLLTDEVFAVAFNGQDVAITCPNNSTETVPRAAFDAFLPAAPAENLCDPAARVEACQVDADCARIDPDFVCCDVGDGSICTDFRSCQGVTPQVLCNQDNECGQGVGCCERESVRVCDPIVCGGQLCCDVQNREVCGGTPEACLFRQSCLAPTLECFGNALEFDQCFVFGDTGVLQADYVSGARALYYTTQNLPGRRASFDVLPCFQAIETSGPDGYEILDLQNNGSFQITIDGQDALVTCSDQQQEVVPLAAVQAFLPPAPPVNLCALAPRNDECQIDGDCLRFGPDSICCDGGVQNLCLPGGGDCADVTPTQTCVQSADCPEGTGCCAQPNVRICDPAVCGDDICCNVESASVCSEVCLLCNVRSDCEGDQVCCSFTGLCSTAEACIPEPECEVDGDCNQGFECCKAGQTNSCAPTGTCPDPCRSSADCGNGRLCCGSQSDGFGAYCATSVQCNDVGQLACVTNADCGGGQLCCRTLDVPACVAASACPVACIEDADCGGGQECCQEEGRTPVCVASGSCRARLGEPCAVASDCTDGLTCCAYDRLGDVCVPQADCNQQVPAVACGQNPSLCDAFTLATCCLVNGVSTCSTRLGCDEPFFSCAENVDCGASGSVCCEDEPVSFCGGFAVGCEGGNPF